MRTTLLFITLVPITLSAQTTFAPIGAKWTYTQHHAFSPDSNLFVIESVGDTVIQGLTCSILEHTEGFNACMPFHRYVGTMGDSVVFWSVGANAFRTLYVFGVPMGSNWSLQADYNADWTNTEVLTWGVQDTSSIQAGATTLRTADVIVLALGGGAMSPLSSGIIVERLGDLNYMFPWISGVCDGEYNYPLRCYEDDEVSWTNPAVMQCELSTGLEEQTTYGTMIPSVAHADETVSITTNGGSGHLEVFDASGRRLVNRTFQGSTEMIFANAGVHILRFTEEGSRPVVRRVMVY